LLPRRNLFIGNNEKYFAMSVGLKLHAALARSKQRKIVRENRETTMSKFTRRQFLHDALIATTAASTAHTALALLAATADTKSAAANEKLGICVIGVNGRGRSHLANFAGNRKNNTEVVVICDVDKEVGEKQCVAVAEKQGGRKPVFFRDIRQALEDKSIDCVSIATPNHWHALAAIWAMQAGKDVYVEKPVCHNVSEGQRMIEAARKYDKICQAGTQARSHTATQQTIQYVQSGKLGEVNLARALCYKPRGSIGPKGDYSVPAYIDYDLWCGPIEARIKSPYKGVHYNWHWFWSTGNGDLGNQGIHQMDVARWGLGLETLANGVISYGGRFGYEDAGESANTQVVVLDYGPKTLVFEVRGLKTEDFKGTKIGVVFEGTEGYAVITDDYGSGAAFDRNGKLIQSFKGGGESSHFTNFIQAVRSRRRADLNAEVEEGFLSSALCHLGNISYQLGNKAAASEMLERLQSVKMADNAQVTLDRTIEHLARNEVKLDSDSMLRCGRYLKFDPKSYEFADSKANQMLSSDYRAPFVVPGPGKV
jgi:predicted dehydrogenase